MSTTDNEKNLPGQFPRSPYDEIGGLVYFRRMADKARRHAAGKLPDDYVPYLGGSDPGTFDGRCCLFLQISYDAFVVELKKGLSDEELFAWAIHTGHEPSAKEKGIWNAFMCKRGWRDESTKKMPQHILVNGADYRPLTRFDQFDAEEGRAVRYPGGPEIQHSLPSRPLLIPDLRSPYETLGGVVHFPRMLDKIRLHKEGKLPTEWVNAKGVAKYFDGMCCEFLGVSFDELEKVTLQGASDESVLNWVVEHGIKRTPEQLKIWNTYMAKRNWRDEHTPRLQFRLGELGVPGDAVPTMFDYIDLDEGRPVKPLSWTLPY